MIGQLFVEKTLVITGHYGSGKTNLAVNMALGLREEGEQVTLADLDIVNPYFRSADFKDEAERRGIGFVVSEYANTNLDIPSLSAALDAKIGGEGRLVIDVGGDDAGAYALGRYSSRIQTAGYALVYVVNAYRYLTREPEEALGLLRQIEAASRMQATCIVNNSNLSYRTELGDVERSRDYAERVAAGAGIPLAFTALRGDLYDKLSDKQGYYPVDIHVRTLWNPED